MIMEKHTFIFNDVHGQAISQTVLFLTQTFSEGFYFIQDNKAEKSLSALFMKTS